MMAATLALCAVLAATGLVAAAPSARVLGEDLTSSSTSSDTLPSVAGHQKTRMVYTDSWVAHIPAGKEVADAIAHKNGFKNVGQVGDLKNYFHFKHICERSDKDCISKTHHSANITDTFKAHPHVHWVEQQVHRERIRRTEIDLARQVPLAPPSGDAPRRAVAHPNETLARDRRDAGDIQIPDPLFSKQWHLYQANGEHINVKPVWRMGITGYGVVVTIVDDGIEHDHPDLLPNYDPKASTDLNGHDDDAYPNEADPINKHGTRCCGQVSAAKNNVCGIGVAYESSIGGIRMLDGPVTDSVEAASLSLNPQHVDVYSNSWGPNDDGRTLEGPGPLARQAIINTIASGRGGLGNIIIFASGNGGRSSDNCNCDGYTNSRYTVSIGAIAEDGKAPWYTEQCASTLTVVYSSGAGGQRSITTIDLHHGCTSDHTGTSAAAPLAAGIVALMLQANPKLSWRDVQHVLIHGAQMTDPTDPDWVTTKAGLKVNHKYGFGKMDAKALVDLSKTWQSPGEYLSYTTPVSQVGKAVLYATGYKEGTTATIDISKANTKIEKLEHVEIHVNIDAQKRGDIEIELIAPSGTGSMLLTPRPSDYDSDGLHWTFTTMRNWDESPVGTWTIYVRNKVSVVHTGTFRDWQITVYGTAGTATPQCAPGTFRSGADCLPCHTECSNHGCSGPTAADCIACQNYRTQEGDKVVCVRDCEDVKKLAADIGGEKVCVDCDPQCSGCVDATPRGCINCTNLARTEGLNKVCVGSCSSDEYEEDGWCKPCHAECFGCVGAGTSMCSSCRNFVAEDGSCLASCPKGTYLEPGTKDCKTCSAECSSDGCTGPQPTDCVACKGAFIKVRLPGQDNLAHECLDSCPAGRTLSTGNECVCPGLTYADYASLACQPCNKACGEGCHGPTLQDCDGKCAELQLENECVSVCRDGTFATTDVGAWKAAHPQYTLKADRVCMPCHDLCAETCTGPTASDCAMFDAPRPGQTGERRLCALFQVGQTCVEDCPMNTFVDEGGMCSKCHAECDGCNGATAVNCIECKNVMWNNECRSECPALYYVSPEKACEPCHEECGETCFGPSNAQCFPSHEEQTTGTPVCKNLVDENACVAKCDVGHYTSDAKTCLHCHDECSLAEGCRGPLATDCNKCKHVKAGNECVRTCDDTPLTYANYQTMTCDACHASCTEGCRGSGPDECITAACASTTCPPGQRVTEDCSCVAVTCPMYSDAGECVSECPAGKYPDDANLCQPCNELCSACSGPDLRDCVACKYRKYFKDDSKTTGTAPDEIHFVCVENCPPWAYEKDKSTCAPCNSECEEGCSGPGPEACNSCQNVKYQGKCVAACPKGTYIVAATKTCEPCNSECSLDDGCTDGTNQGCVKCAHVKYGGKCINECPSNTIVSGVGICLNCHDECRDGCVGLGADNCVNGMCKHFKYGSTCVFECPSMTYDDGGICRPCSAACVDGTGCTGPSPGECLATTRSTTPINHSEESSATTTKATFSPTTKATDHSTSSDGSEAHASAIKSSGTEIAVATIVIILLVGSIIFIVYRTSNTRVAGSNIQSRVSYKHLDFGDEEEEEEDLVLDLPDSKTLLK